MIIRVAIYARTSVDCPFSGDDQVQRLKTVAAERGLTVVATFTDRPTSARGPDRRPGEAALIDAICNGTVDRVMIWSVCRIGKSLVDLVTFTIECSGNNGLPFLTSAIGNARWDGTPLAEVLRNAGVKSSAFEVVFFGADSGEETVRRDTPLEFKYTGNFARSMPIADAMNSANLLCYEMNGSPLPAANGFPCRLIVPGWYGVANVKWLTRIEVRGQRFLGRFMGRDYVTIREERHGDKTVMAETSVGRMLLKSAPAKVVQRDGRYQIDGMAWGPQPIAAVDVKIDDGAWTKATLGESEGEFAWRSWKLDWSPTSGEHAVTSWAIDSAGNIQPTMDDPLIANKKTYWESNGQITRHIRIA